MKLNSKVSIIVPIYNSGNTIKRCIDSLLEQSYANIEIILVNDGSTDESEEICNRYKSNKVHYFFKSNNGVSSARNFGIEQANGRYILFVDADDTIEKSLIEEMVNIIENSHNILVGCQIRIVEEDLERIEKRKSNYTVNDFIEAFLSNIISGYSCGYLFDAKKIDKFDESTGYMEDTIFLIKYLRQIEQIKMCDNYYNYIINMNSTTQKGELEIVKKNIININYSLWKVEKELEKFNLKIDIKQLINEKKNKVIESECAKLQSGEEIIKLLKEEKIKEIFKKALLETKDIKYIIFLKIILKEKKVLLNIYLYARRFFKNIKRRIK